MASQPVVELCPAWFLLVSTALLVLILRPHVYDFTLQMAFIYFVSFETYNHPVK